MRANVSLWLVVAAACVGLVSLPAQGQWTLLEDFESYTAGTSIENETLWFASLPGGGGDSSIPTTEVDPTDAGNQLLKLPSRDFDGAGNLLLAYDDSGQATPLFNIADGTTATVFFRVYAVRPEHHFGVAFNHVHGWGSYAAHQNWRKHQNTLGSDEGIQVVEPSPTGVVTVATNPTTPG